MIKHLPLLLFIGLVWGQEDLLIKKAESSIKDEIINVDVDLDNK